jgi:hypothetical protein
MKNKTLICFFISGLIILTQQVYAQYPAIDSLKLIPTNPTTNDQLQVVCYTTFPSGSCNLNSYHVEQQGNDIFLTIDYTVGMATYICHSVDTIPIDNPGAGTFLLTTTITENNQDVLEDVAYLPFTIDPYLGISKFESNNFSVYPNPFKNELRVKSNFTIKKLEIQAVSGQKINLKESFSNTVDVSNLEPGIYLITLIDTNGNGVTQRIIKNPY